MGILVHRSWIAVLSCVLFMGGEVWCDCSEQNLDIEGGHFTLSKQFERGSKVTYHCPDGFYPHPEMERTCQLNGRWKPAPKKFRPQKCKLVECPDPNVLEYGSVSPPQEKYFVGNETTYECYSGYNMRGSTKRICLKNGKWSGFTPICSNDIHNNCADPGIPAGALRTGNTFGIDDKVTYSCNGNLFLVGSKERVCQENGEWSGQEPACYFRYTFDTPQEASGAFSSGIRDTLTILKPINDTQYGKSLRILKNGTMNIYIAVDISESIKEKEFDTAKDAVTKLLQKISSFTVNPNYEIIFFSSEIFEVANILDFLDKTTNYSTVIENLKTFKRIGKESGTDLNLALKTILERMQYMKEGNFKDRVHAFADYRHVIILFTDGVYNMGGSPLPTVEMIKNMVYMNATTEAKDPPRDEYLDIYVFAIGATPFDEDLQPLTVGVGGKHYYRLKDISNLGATFDEMINQDDVVGLCGLHKESNDPSLDEELIKRYKYPWFIFIIIKDKKCTGSLVNSKFILTAAHCFPFGTLPEDVTVEIELTEHKVTNFYIHPDYNVTAKSDIGVKEFYDYDVALIQMEEELPISTSLRPICIPCTKETRDALKLDVNSTCADQEKALFKDHQERLSFLTKTTNIVDEADVYAKLGDSRPNCIKHALEAEDMPKTINVQDVVTENFLCTGGKSPYINDIACKGDSGGALFKMYQHRMIQVGVVSWGTKDLCSGRQKPSKPFRSEENTRDFHINLFRVLNFLKSILGNDDQNEYAPMTFLE
ncbi:complement factor B-like [Parambassis ranga]|uniref:C3/C5 convertase n=1 Tax=Parambassis ranga TaxID=210632 RepID=A0A6P7JMA7_9TELE|nr:complement factor B-like [Parambassis ranga]